MKTLVYGIAALIILSGAVFALQGLSLLPSRAMYGKPEWIVIGGVMVVAGAAMVAFTRLRSTRSKTGSK